MVRIEIAAMNALRLKHQVRKRQLIERFGFRATPVVPDELKGVAGVPRHLRGINHQISLLLLL